MSVISAGRARTLAYCVLAVLITTSITVLTIEPAHAATFTVNKTGNAKAVKISDTRCDSSRSRDIQSSLRAAIQ